jgi:hypothetical protein
MFEFAIEINNTIIAETPEQAIANFREGIRGCYSTHSISARYADERVKAVKVENLRAFLNGMDEAGANSDAILFQLDLFLKGVRDERLSDSCIALIDGEVDV